jgi:hypothetical protein
MSINPFTQALFSVATTCLPCCEPPCCSGAYQTAEDFTRSADASVSGSTLTLNASASGDTLAISISAVVCLTIPAGTFTITYSPGSPSSVILASSEGVPLTPTSEEDGTAVYEIDSSGCYCINVTFTVAFGDTVSGTLTGTTDGGDLGCQGAIDMIDESGPFE